MTISDEVVMSTWLLVSLGVLGILVGSFLNVVIARVPEGKSIVRPRSCCPHCSAPISGRDNIPILSWILLRGRCRGCGIAISIQYPLVEALTGFVWLLLGWWGVLTAPNNSWINPLLPLALIAGSFLIALSIIDIEWQRLPNQIVFLLYPITIAGFVVALAVGDGWSQFPSLTLSGLAGALLWLGVIGSIWFITHGKAMGLGDVKLAPVLGAILGWQTFSSAAVGLLLAFVMGGVAGIFLIIFRETTGKSKIAFGPFLILGFFIGLTAGPALWEGYLGIVGI